MDPVINGSPNPTLGPHIAPSSLIEITTDRLTFFRHFDKDYLQEQYVVLGKSMNQIAREKGCARSTVSVALGKLGFTIKAQSELQCSKGQVPFGFRSVHGNLVPHLGENEVLSQMADMRSSGASFGQIVTWLNSERIQTKKRIGKWDRPTVYKILKSQSLMVK